MSEEPEPAAGTQFGRPIGSFQAVKHRLADVAIALEFARPLVAGAAAALTGNRATAARDTSAAKVAATDAARLAARAALQVHGAIGYTQELDLHLWLTKVQALANAWGTQAGHRTRILAALTAAPDDHASHSSPATADTAPDDHTSHSGPASAEMYVYTQLLDGPGSGPSPGSGQSRLGGPVTGLALTGEQRLLRDSVRGLLDSHAEAGAGSQAGAGPGSQGSEGYDEALWRRLSGETGVAGLLVPESYGGAGASLADVRS